MDRPIFKLEKVVHTHPDEEMQDFEGPLDLILYLLHKNKMSIQDISITEILNQYLAWLDVRRKMDLEIASVFVTMASHLMYIKTRMLLSLEDDEVQSEVESLIQSLEERRRSESYETIRALARQLEMREEFGRLIETREPEPSEHEKIFEYHHDRMDLILAMTEIQNRTEQKMPPPKSAFDGIIHYDPYPMIKKAREIIAELRQNGTMRFRRLFFSSRSRSEIVATFLAVLELCRAALIRLNGAGVDDCTVVRQKGHNLLLSESEDILWKEQNSEK